ncbi:MAG TPA: ABC transporter permease [Candidatus Acidoferrales bacterium]|nr:ABC transporter permease [Candidatus Acidoferrales bacterium]
MTVRRKLSSWLSWLPWYHRQSRDADLARELRDHLELEAEDQRDAGLSPKEATNAAHRALGNTLRIEEDVRAAWGFQWLETFAQDLRYGFRMQRKSPGFTVVAVLTLALGIGANTAIFSMVDSLFLRSSAVGHAEQLKTLAFQRIGGDYDSVFSYPDFQDIRKQSTEVFSQVAASMDFSGTDSLSIDGKQQPIWTSAVSDNFFDALELKPALGNFIEPVPGKPTNDQPEMVLGYAYWKAHFGGDPGVVGKSALINGHAVTIIGVAPKDFHSISTFLDMQGYLPFGMAAITGDASKDFLTSRKAAGITIYARLKSGVTLGASQSALKVIGRRLAAQYPVDDNWNSLLAYSLGPLSPYDDPAGPAVILLMCVLFLVLTGLVLLLACLNVANLLLARASAREREMAVRAAVGAARSRLVRQLLTESLILALLGCAGGIAFGRLGSHWLSSINLNATIPFVLDFQFDWRVFAYALAAAVLTGIVVGIAPAVRATRGDLNDVLHKSGRTATASRQRARGALVVAQVGGSLMLLIVAGLFVRSLQKARHLNLGFDPNHVLNFTLDAREAGLSDSQGRDFLQNLLTRVRALPGVETASLAATVPMGFLGYDGALKIQGYQPPPNQSAPSAGFNAVSPEYFSTMRIPILRGRAILDSDTQTSPHVAVINEAMAEKYWHGQDPIGKEFTIQAAEKVATQVLANTNDPQHPVTVVGIARNSRIVNFRRPFQPYMFLPLSQKYETPVTLQVRTSLPLAIMSREIVELVHSLTPTMPVLNIQTMTAALDTLAGLLLYQIGAALAASLGILGLTLAIVGVYGVVSCAASQRTHEIGIRLALGAQRIDILQMVLRQGLLIVGIGVLVGVLAAAGFARLVGNFLSGVSPLDPLTYISASVLLAAIALLACYIPARRAMRVDPMVALRYE